MDARLAKALDFSNYMVTLNNQKRLLAEKYQDDLLYFYNGSQFTVTCELITFVNIMISSDQDELVIIDDNNFPCLIENLADFYDNIVNVYMLSSNNYHSQYLKLQKNRSVEKLVNYE
jgi:hypothetical protein